MALIDGYRFADLHVKELTARLELRRGTGQAFMRAVRLPRSARAGSRIPVKIDLVHVGGRKETITETVRLPRRPRRGFHELTFTGTDSDDGAGDIFGALTTLLLGDEGDEDTGGDPGPATLEELRKAIRRVERWDGVRMRVDRRRGHGRKAFRNADLRLSGRVRGFIRLR
jgi:hypothetical protein